jgi:hypothetical protein
MTDDERSVYGNDIDNLKEDLKNGVELAKNAFAKAGDVVEGYMTSG